MLELMIGEPLPIGGAGPEPLPSGARDEDEARVAIGDGIVALERAHRSRAALVEDVPICTGGIGERALVEHGGETEKCCWSSRLIIVDECSSFAAEPWPSPANWTLTYANDVIRATISA